jgi:protoheme IX farnesyltransferase
VWLEDYMDESGPDSGRGENGIGGGRAAASEPNSQSSLALRRDSLKALMAPYLELTKPRIVSLVLVTTLLGYFLAGGSLALTSSLSACLIGTALCCGGSGALNQYLERDADQRMIRTRFRPIPAGIIPPAHALSFGVLLVLSGTGLLLWQVNLLTAFLAILTAFLYVIVYTPLKKLTWLNTLIGAIPGALPPVGGWAAASGTLDAGAWVLFLILFIWQHPHFYAIAWMYREDYLRGGFKMLSVVDPTGDSMFRQVMGFSLVLIPVAFLPCLIGMAGWTYMVGSLLLGLFMLRASAIAAKSRSLADARNLLKASVLYLPLLLLLIVVDAKF